MKYFLSILLFFTMLDAYPNYSQAIKEKKIYPIGKKIYLKKCSDIDVKKYDSYDSLKNSIKSKNLCGKLNNRYLEILSVYLWDQKDIKEDKTYDKLEVTKKDKCPICGMFLYKYPRWISRIVYNDTTSYSFDGIKDMMKYYFIHDRDISLILVQDYYTDKVIDATKAYFVIGSDVYGPMGNEFIAFKTKKLAQKFMLDHRGKKVLKFKEITLDIVNKLDE